MFSSMNMLVAEDKALALRLIMEVLFAFDIEPQPPMTPGSPPTGWTAPASTPFWLMPVSRG